MRTTVTLSPDVAAAVREVQKEQNLGLSAALDELVRRGLTTARPAEPFVQKTFPMGMRVDVRNIGEVLDLLDGPEPG